MNDTWSKVNNGNSARSYNVVALMLSVLRCQLSSCAVTVNRMTGKKVSFIHWVGSSMNFRLITQKFERSKDKALELDAQYNFDK